MSFPSPAITSQMRFKAAHMQTQLAQGQEKSSCTSSAHGPQHNALAHQFPLELANSSSYFTFSQAWLQAAAVDLLTQFPSPIVPAIRPDYVYQPPKSRYPLYIPRALWNVRCLSPRERHELYIEFCVFGHTMQRHGLGTPEYKSAFDLIVEKSNEIAHKERQWYAKFAGQQETKMQRARDLGAIVAQQAHPVDIRATFVGSGPGDSAMTAIVVEQHGQKRRAPSSALEADHRPAKKVAQEFDEALRQQRAAKAEADHCRYLEQKQLIDDHYLHGDSTRKPTDPEWQKLAVFDAYQAACQTSQPTKKGKRSCSKNAEASDADIVDCPKIPSLNLASYPMKTANTYMCLHIDCACQGEEDCTARTHNCCRKGLNLRELNTAVRRRYERTCARIEELAFRDGKLDRCHKTWDGWFSKAMREQDSSREKAHLPRLGWKYDPRSSQAGSPTNSKVAEMNTPPRKEAQQQPAEVCVLPDDDPLLLAFMEAYEEDNNGIEQNQEPADVEDIVAPEQPPESTVEENDPLLLALINAFEEDEENGAEPTEGPANVENTNLELFDDLDKELFGEGV
ncbi:hypothetical protein yc1106_09531 [Curvularia clavata]|uniref:Uncharacterized protein n=1 Tax=Curvularia clavata TaxID=95742 RepID=A0A9Q8ZF79_CURCL|nr:hypothetical protein yc1106_09531 [Curvularia clavata]